MANWWEQDTAASSNTDWWAKDDSAPGTVLRGLNYGPIVGEHTHDTMFGPVGNALENQDVALSPNVGYPLGTSLDVYSPKSGEFLGTHRVADASYYHPNQPTRNTIELRDKMVDGPLFVTPHSGGENWWKNDAPAQAPASDAIPTYASQQVGPPQPEGSVFTDPQARADLVANVKQGLKDFIPTLKQGVATTVPRNREELVSALQDVTQKAAAPYEESMYRTVGPEKYDQPALDLSSPYSMVPGLPPGLIPELAKIKGPVGDYIRSQVEASPKHEPSGYERFGQAALAAASQLTTPHSLADIYSFKTPGAQQAFAAERALSVPEQAQRVKQAYDEQGLPEASATGLNEAIMDILPSLHDAGNLRTAGQYHGLLPTPEAKPYIDQPPGQVYFQPGDAEATALRTQAGGQQMSPEYLQAITQALQRRDTGLPNLEGEAGSPNRELESAIEKALRRTTLSPLRSATELSLSPQQQGSIAQLDRNANDVSLGNDVSQRPAEVPLRPEKEPNQGAETDLAPGSVANEGTTERQNNPTVRNPASVERPGQSGAGAESGQGDSAETLAGQINTETGRAERGLDPREEVLRREFGKSVELAQKKEATNPGAGQRLVDRLEKSPKAVNDPDHVLLARQVIQAQDEYDQAAREVAANPDDAEAKHAADIADERIQKAYQAYDNAGTGTARGLAIRGVLKAHDYTLPAMQARFRTKVGDLTAAQAREIKGIHERITAADETLGKAYAGLDPEDVKRFAKGVRGTKLSDYSQDKLPALFKDVVDELERAHPDMHALTVKALAAARVRNSLWRVFDDSEQRLQTEQLSPAENHAYDSIAMDEWNPNQTLQDISGSRTMAEDIENPIAQLPLDTERLPDVRTPKEQELASFKERAAGVAQREEARKAQAAEKTKAYQQKVQLENLDSEIALHRKWLANPEKISAPRLNEIRRDLSKLEAKRNAIQPETKLYAGLDPEDLKQFGRVYHGSRTGELTEIQAKAPSFNFFGRDGIYLTTEKGHARAYANGFEARPGEVLGNGRVHEVDTSNTKPIAADKALGADAGPLVEAIKKEAQGMSKVGMAVLEDKLSKVTPETKLNRLAAEGVDVASYIGRAVKSLGYDSIKDGNVLVLLDPTKAKIVSSHAPDKFYAGLDPEDIAKRLGRDVKRISKDTADYQKRTTDENIEPRKPKAEPLMSPEKQKALEDREQAKAEYHQMIARELYKQLPASKRLINKLVQLERSIKLTGVTTFAKLGSAGATRVAQTAAEELVGHAYSLVPGVRGTMMSAPTERPALPSDVGAYVKGFGKGIMQTGKVLKGKVDTMDVSESTKAYQPPSILDIPGRTHGAIKNPFKQAQASMAASKAERAFARTGEVFNSDAIDKMAKQSGLRAILTNDNMVSTAYNRGVQYLESKGDAGFLGAKTMQFFLPIVRVPTNIALEAGQMIGGVPMGGGKLLMSAMRGGIKEMTPLERDFVARSFKKGTVGLGLFSIGFFNPNNFGGFYQEKRKQGDVRWNEAKLGGVRIPWYLMHSAAALTMNAGATVRKLMDKEHESATVASMSTSKSLLHEVPFAEFIENIDKLLSKGYEGTNARGRLLQSSIVPQGVKNMAEFLDAAEKRYPRNELEYVKAAVPGLREEVPSIKPKKGH